MTHLIQQQTIQVQFNGPAHQAIECQRQLAELCQEGMISALQGALDRCVDKEDERVYHFSKVEIDLGDWSMAKLGAGLNQALADALELQLKKQIRQFSQGSLSTTESVEDSTLSKPWAVLMHYLQQGQLPWNFYLPPKHSLEAYFWFFLAPLRDFNQVLPDDLSTQDLLKIPPKQRQEVHAALPIRELIILLSQTESARKRLLWGFSKTFVLSLLQLLSPTQHQLWLETSKTLQGQGTPPTQEQTERSLLEIFLQQLATPLTKLQALETLQFLLKPGVHSASTQRFLKPPRQPTLIEKAVSMEHQLNETEESTGATSKPLIEKSIAKQNTEWVQVLPEKVADFALNPEDALYIDNAGLIILHPFISSFLEGLELAQGGKLLLPERAILLLQHLCTGQKQAAEYEISLPKILCNVPMHQPLDLPTELKEHELDEANTLLKAVLQHWSALKGTQVEELRGNFLCRKGKLSRQGDDDWLLQVERKSYDILLDKLPWGIGTVKLPWMPGLLWVEW